MTTVATQQPFSPNLKAFIIQSIYEVLDDPDFGMELTEVFKKKLVAAKHSKRRSIPLSEVRKKYY